MARHGDRMEGTASVYKSNIFNLIECDKLYGIVRMKRVHEVLKINDIHNRKGVVGAANTRLKFAVDGDGRSLEW